MRADTESQAGARDPSSRDAGRADSLTDVMDQMAREKLERWVKRRHGVVPYRLVIESLRLTTTKSS